MFRADSDYITLRCLLLLSVFLLMSGCSRLIGRNIVEPDPSLTIQDPQAVSRVLAALEQSNQGLNSFKGIARVKFGNLSSSLQSARAVFAGHEDQRLRFDILSLAGQPVTSVAYDGIWFYMTQHSENRFYRRRSHSADLERLINIPIKIKTVNSLLRGQVPIAPHTDVDMMRDRSGNGYTLILKSGWRQRVCQKIYLKADRQTVWKYEMFESGNSPVYSLEIQNYKRFQTYPIPQRIEVTGGDGSTLVLEVVRYWPDAEVDPSMFVLASPP